MKFIPAELPGLVIIEPDIYNDERGWFMESFNQRRFDEGLASLGLSPGIRFVQDNQSCSLKGVLRGLHYQLEPFAQGKLVSVTKGAAFDVAVDIRRESPTFGQWFGTELNATQKRMLWIPAGFAHGFLALEEETHFSYKTTEFYDKAHERSILWDDGAIGVQWPELDAYLISDKDRLAPLLQDAELE